MMKFVLGASLILNAVLALLIVLDKPGTANPSTETLCKAASDDIDFLVTGLEQGNHRFYTPIVTRSLGHLVKFCAPGNSASIDSKTKNLRGYMAAIFVPQTPPQKRREAIQSAIDKLGELGQILKGTPR